jgi:hypothetical protein
VACTGLLGRVFRRISVTMLWGMLDSPIFRL